MRRRGKDIPYSESELKWIKGNCTMPRREAHAAFCKEFGRSDVSADNFKGLCKRKGWRTGRDGRLQPGNVSWNKGKKMPYNTNSARTQFKKGHLPHNTKYLGHERISKDGFIEISIAEKNPHTGYERRYVLKHKRLWEQKHGPVPKGMCLKALDGNRMNADPDNWELIPRSVLLLMNRDPRLNYQDADPEARPAIMALAKLRHAIGSHKRRRHDTR